MGTWRAAGLPPHRWLMDLAGTWRSHAHSKTLDTLLETSSPRTWALRLFQPAQDGSQQGVHQHARCPALLGVDGAQPPHGGVRQDGRQVVAHAAVHGPNGVAQQRAQRAPGGVIQWIAARPCGIQVPPSLSTPNRLSSLTPHSPPPPSDQGGVEEEGGQSRPGQQTVAVGGMGLGQGAQRAQRGVALCLGRPQRQLDQQRRHSRVDRQRHGARGCLHASVEG